MGGRKTKKRTQKSSRLTWLISISVVLAVIFLGLLTWLIIAEVGREEQSAGVSPPVPSGDQPTALTGTPQLTTEVVVSGRQNIWDVGFLPSGQMLFTERGGTVSLKDGDNLRQIANIGDVYASGEGGLLGLAIDPQFTTNRHVYTCFNSTQGGPDVRVVRWKLNNDLTALEERTDIITGIPSNTSGRHSGCRLAFGTDGYLWVGTGDAAQGSNPQDPTSLGGKILRVDRDGNAPERGNLSGEFDPRIYSYGHRNVQGLAMLTTPNNGVFGVSLEHGPSIDDELNLLQSGNFGWDPVPGYNESVPMTDKTKYPDSIPAVWSSGSPTQAPSGSTFVYGTKWRDWSGALMVATLKDQKLKMFRFDDNLQIVEQQDLLEGQFGRLRAAVQGPNEDLYITTDNGQDDKIIRITPN